ERFREHAVSKLVKIEKLDPKATRVDVEVSKEPNPRQSGRRERVELTILSRGPVIRAEACADDRYTALDLAFAKLEARLRRACDRRKERHGDRDLVRAGSAASAPAAPEAGLPDVAAADVPVLVDEPAPSLDGYRNGHRMPRPADLRIREWPEEYDLDEDLGGEESASAHFVPIQMEGDGPLVVREKLHPAEPMTIDQALLEMELVGHDFYLFHDRECDLFSVVYRRRGYDYGVIRLMEGAG